MQKTFVELIYVIILRSYLEIMIFAIMRIPGLNQALFKKKAIWCHCLPEIPWFA